MYALASLYVKVRPSVDPRRFCRKQRNRYFNRRNAIMQEILEDALEKRASRNRGINNRREFLLTAGMKKYEKQWKNEKEIQRSGDM